MQLSNILQEQYKRPKTDKQKAYFIFSLILLCVSLSLLLTFLKANWAESLGFCLTLGIITFFGSLVGIIASLRLTRKTIIRSLSILIYFVSEGLIIALLVIIINDLFSIG